MRGTLKNTLLAGLLLLAAAGAVAAPPDWTPAVWNDFPVRLELADRAELERLLAAVPVASFDREQLRPRPDGSLVWEPRVTGREAEALNRAGWNYTRLRDRLREGRTATEAAWAQRATAKAELPLDELTTYPTHAEIGTLLQQIATAHPTIARTVTWGTSIQGRELWGLVISDDVQNTEPEPEVRLSSSMHGDETVGIVMLMNLADYLTANYGQTGFEDVTALVDGTELHLLPLHNPDGYVAGVRYNANSVDLNRNFLEPDGTHTVLEQENEIFAAYSRQQHFVISANAHGGALLVNYPWDYTVVRAPDDAAIQLLSLEYSTRNLPMYNGAFTQGISNGFDWYYASGTLQDWSYDQTGCIDVTLELSDTKWPPPLYLPQYWLENRDSYLAYVASVRWGVNGVVTDAASGAPLDAVITVTGNDQPVTTDPEHGDYYKLLPTGTWTVTVAADGYHPATVTDVATTWGTATVLDVELHAMSPSHVPEAPVASVRAAPNPFNGGTSIGYVNPGDGWMELAVYDLHGRRVISLVAERRPAGPDSVRWDGRNDRGQPVGSGVYFARLQAAGGQTAVVKVGVVK